MFENNCLCTILKIRLQHRVSVNEIRNQAKQQNPTESVTWKRRLTWFGHACRMNNENLQKIMMKEDFDKRRNRGRPHKRCSGVIKKDTGIPDSTAEKYAKDNNIWGNNVNIRWAKPHIMI